MPLDIDTLLAEAAQVEHLAAEKRDRVFAAWFCASVEIAAREYPERLIRALGRVFDPRPLLEEAEQVRQELRSLRFECKPLAKAIADDLDALDQRMTAIETRMEKAARAFGVLAEFYRERNRPANGTAQPARK